MASRVRASKGISPILKTIDRLVSHGQEEMEYAELLDISEDVDLGDEVHAREITSARELANEIVEITRHGEWIHEEITMDQVQPLIDTYSLKVQAKFISPYDGTSTKGTIEGGGYDDFLLTDLYLLDEITTDGIGYKLYRGTNENDFGTEYYCIVELNEYGQIEELYDYSTQWEEISEEWKDMSDGTATYNANDDLEDTLKYIYGNDQNKEEARPKVEASMASRVRAGNSGGKNSRWSPDEVTASKRGRFGNDYWTDVVRSIVYAEAPNLDKEGESEKVAKLKECVKILTEVFELDEHYIIDFDDLLEEARPMGDESDGVNANANAQKRDKSELVVYEKPADSSGTSFHNVTIQATYNELVKALGNPTYTVDVGIYDRFAYEWSGEINGEKWTLYDWREGEEIYDNLDGAIDWHIGAKNRSICYDVQDAIQNELNHI